MSTSREGCLRTPSGEWCRCATVSYECAHSAVEEGVCGVPSFSVDGGPVVWGQDKLNVVADMLCGWKDTSAKL